MYTFSLVSSSEIKLHNREIAIEATGGAHTPRRLYVPPTPHTEHGELLKGSNRAVTTCRLPLQTVGIVDIPQHLANLDTMSTCDTPDQGLIGLIGYSYQQDATSFSEAGLKRTPRLSVLGPE